MSRRTMLAPIRPRPIMPTCIRASSRCPEPRSSSDPSRPSERVPSRSHDVLGREAEPRPQGFLPEGEVTGTGRRHTVSSTLLSAEGAPCRMNATGAERVPVTRCSPFASVVAIPSAPSGPVHLRARILDRPHARSVAGSDPALVSLEPPRPPGLPGTLARLVRLERRHVDARRERRVAHDRARAVAAHGFAHADGDQPAVLPPGASRRRPRLPPEDVPGAMRAGVRYVRHSAPFRAVLARTAAFVVPASALWALLPLFARRGLELSATGYGLLLGCLGAGAIVGAAFLPRVRERLTSDRLVLAGTAVFAAVSAVVALARVPLIAGGGLFIGGMAWMGAMSTLSVAAQNAVPAWVRARALAVGLLAVQGSMALGSLLWGVVATHSDIPTALVAGAAMLLAGAVASRRFVLHGLSNLDLRPDPRWSLPETACQLDGDEGPVLVPLEYDVDPDQAEEFMRAVRRLEPVRRRDGAIRWSVYRDTEDPNRWLEVFVVESWLEHLRQHERVTADDRALFEAAARFDRGRNGPRVRHHIAGRQVEQLRWDDRAAG